MAFLRTLLPAAAALLLAASTAALAQEPAATLRIPKLTGNVVEANAFATFGAIAEREDSIIGLKLWVDPSAVDAPEPQIYIVAPPTAEGNAFTLFARDAADETSGIELVLPQAEDVMWMHGSHVIDGFFLVKSGGMNQGILSYALKPVDEAAVLLSPKALVVEERIPDAPAP